MTRNTTPRSGTSKDDELPPLSQRRTKGRQRATPPAIQPPVLGILPYPTLFPLSATPEIKNLLCYIIRHYGTGGLSVVVERHKADNDVDVGIVYGDWRGVRIDIKEETQSALAARYFHEHHLKMFVETMRLIRIQQAQFYLGIGKDDMVLTDIRLGPYKLTGPGMVRDIFGKLMKTQDVAKIELVDDKVLDAIERGFGSYAGDLILKPSRFRTIERPELGACPLYVEVRR